MQLYILDKNPRISANLIPDKYKFKMLIELCQLICSAGISDVYKPIKQGKELQKWIKDNLSYTLEYMNALFESCLNIVNVSDATRDRILEIVEDFEWHNAMEFDHNRLNSLHNVKDGYFRYTKEYKCDIPSKTLLPIDQCIAEYKKYLEWKLKGDCKNAK